MSRKFFIHEYLFSFPMRAGQPLPNPRSWVVEDEQGDWITECNTREEAINFCAKNGYKVEKIQSVEEWEEENPESM